MKKSTLFCITVLLLMARGGLSQHVYYDFDNTADFSKFKSYKWVDFKNPAPIEKLTDDQIKAAVDAALAQKGLLRVNVDTADLLVDYRSSELFDEEFSKAPYGGSRETYSGDLTIEMYTPANHNLVWRGIASKSLDPKAKAEKRQKNLNKAVTKLMKNYPPPK